MTRSRAALLGVRMMILVASLAVALGIYRGTCGADWVLVIMVVLALDSVLEVW